MSEPVVIHVARWPVPLQLRFYDALGVRDLALDLGLRQGPILVTTSAPRLGQPDQRIVASGVGSSVAIARRPVEAGQLVTDGDVEVTERRIWFVHPDNLVWLLSEIHDCPVKVRCPDSADVAKDWLLEHGHLAHELPAEAAG